METFRFVQGEPDCYPFKDYKCPLTGESKKVVFIADIPLEERHKYIDPEQDMNDPRMRTMSDYKIEIVNPLEEQAKQIATLQAQLQTLLSKYQL